MIFTQNDPGILPDRGDHFRGGRPNRIFKTTSADNSPTKFSRRDRARNGNIRQRLARSCLVEDSFHAALLRNIYAEQSVLSFATSADNSYYSGIGTFESNGMQPRYDEATATSFGNDRHDPSALQQYILHLNEHQPPIPQATPQTTGPCSTNHASTVLSGHVSMPTSTYDAGLFPNYTYSWPNDAYQTSKMPSAFASPGIVPTQPSFEEPKTPPPILSGPGDDLVAVGLYDDPISGWSQPTTEYLGGDLSVPLMQSDRPAGKGLKLEETFEPTVIEEQQNDDEEAGVDNEEGNPEEIATDRQSTTHAMNPMQSQQSDLAQQVATIQHQLNMVNRTFLLDNEQDFSLSNMKASDGIELSGNVYMGGYGTGRGWI